MQVVGDQERITRFQFAGLAFGDGNVVISPLVHEIEDKAFVNNTSLQQLIIPDSVYSIGRYAFENCTSLKSVKIYSSHITQLAAGMFANCFSLTDISLTCRGLLAIEDECFRSCYALKNPTLPDTIQHIGDSCFESCYSLNDVVLPQSLMSLGMYAFHNCNSLEQICIPHDVTELKMHSFSHCYELRCVDMHMSHVNCIYNHCFDSCYSLVDVIMPACVQQSIDIKNYAFNRCKSLRKIDICSHAHVSKLCFAGCRDIFINVI